MTRQFRNKREYFLKSQWPHFTSSLYYNWRFSPLGRWLKDRHMARLRREREERVR